MLLDVVSEKTEPEWIGHFKMDFRTDESSLDEDLTYLTQLNRNGNLSISE